MHFPYPTPPGVALFLAPMSGVSESPFRLLCRRFGADVGVSEFISAVGVARGLEPQFAGVTVVRHYSVSEEEARFGLGHLHGAIQVVTSR